MGHEQPLASSLFTFGVCTDLQWADIDDGCSHGGQKRYYRNSLELLKQAALAFKDANVEFAFHLGDIVDAHCTIHAEAAGQDIKAEADRALDLAMQACALFDNRWYHIVGNHCLYNYSRDQLSREYQIVPTEQRLYYSFTPHELWRFVVLDSFDLSIQGWPAGTPEYEAALKLLQSKRSYHASLNHIEHSEGVGRRWVGFGGGVGQQQLEWLASELAAAREAGQKAVVFSHCTFHPEATERQATLMWNYDEVLEVLYAAGNVHATFAGHAHVQGHVQDDRGIHHNVLPALLETPPGEVCHGFVSVFTDSISLNGAGVMNSVHMPKAMPKAAPTSP